jgi:phosphoribosylcarboxyaminoimidazole (NCAIR) mutase
MVQVGVSAQSLEEVLPEAVSTATDDMKTKSVSYGNAALASAVMLAQEVVELKQMMKQLQAELAELKRGA